MLDFLHVLVGRQVIVDVDRALKLLLLLLQDRRIARGGEWWCVVVAVVCVHGRFGQGFAPRRVWWRGWCGGLWRRGRQRAVLDLYTRHAISCCYNKFLRKGLARS